MNVTGTIKIWRKDESGKTKYSTSIGNKKEDGTYENSYLYVNFKKDLNVNIANGTNITLKNAFLTSFKVKELVMRNGNAIEKSFDKFGIVVMDYCEADEGSQEIDGFQTAMDDIPF